MAERTISSTSATATPAVTRRGYAFGSHLLIEQIIIYGLLSLSAIITVVPLLWAIAASFSPVAKVFEYAYPFSWRAFFPVDFTLEAYQNLFSRGFGVAIGNTLLLAMSAVVVGGTVSALAGFAFARFQFRGKNLLFGLILIAFII